MSIQRAPSTAHSTPRATPHPPSVSPQSEDVVRIHVTYNPLAASPSHLQPVSPKYKPYDEHKPMTLGFYTNGAANQPSDNRIRIQVSSDELLTPVVDSGRIITQRYIESQGIYDINWNVIRYSIVYGLCLPRSAVKVIRFSNLRSDSSV